MKPFIPTEEEFDLLLTAIGSYEKEQVTTLVVGQYLKKMEGLTNEEAFLKAFSKADEKTIHEAVAIPVKVINDKVILVSAKVIQFRDFVREQRTTEDIDSLLK